MNSNPLDLTGSCNILVNAKWRFVSEKENMRVRNVWGVSREKKLERKREVGRVICPEKISKSAVGDTINITSEIILVCLLHFLEAV